ncbi:hypothetical protein [Pseudonocardia aurantiaca]|uniref:Uncharacterized protein n=1 Tax=Pseudonocardia aurantiaca TaxID=75290 RepID=A0ABW4FUX4_9PSEU
MRITTLVDNLFDALLVGDDRVTRPDFGTARAAAPQFEGGSTDVGLRAEHGFAALVAVRRATSTTTLLFDTGLSPDGVVVNADRLPAHCTGWRAQHALAAAFPDAWIAGSSGSTYHLAS